MQEYFENVDIKGIFNADVVVEQLNDDRFGGFLDKFYEAGPRKIFSDISITALSIYGLNIKNVNYDTTSKYISVILIREKEKHKRLLQRPLKDSQLKILKYLGLDESIFIGSVLW